MIRNVKKSDITPLAKIYKDLYDNINIKEHWSINKSKELLTYWYKMQKDLFLVYEENGKPIGAIMSGIKPWFDGLRLVDTEIFVSTRYQHQHIGTDLLLAHLKKAKKKYNVKIIEFHTFGDENGFPENWYKKIGFKNNNELIIMNGEITHVLDELC